jgi:ketosteroid isomerase-like protein
MTARALLARDTARAMSRENVEVCKRAFPAINRFDVDAALPYVNPEVVVESAIVSSAEGNVYRGEAGLRRWAADVRAAFDELRSTPEAWQDLGDRVMMLGHAHARGRESGVTIDSEIAFLFTLRDGRIVHAKGFLNHAKALQAAGLEE